MINVSSRRDMGETTKLKENMHEETEAERERVKGRRERDTSC